MNLCLAAELVTCIDARGDLLFSEPHSEVPLQPTLTATVESPVALPLPAGPLIRALERSVESKPQWGKVGVDMGR